MCVGSVEIHQAFNWKMAGHCSARSPRRNIFIEAGWPPCTVCLADCLKFRILRRKGPKHSTDLLLKCVRVSPKIHWTCLLLNPSEVGKWWKVLALHNTQVSFHHHSFLCGHLATTKWAGTSIMSDEPTKSNELVSAGLLHAEDKMRGVDVKLQPCHGSFRPLLCIKLHTAYPY